MEKKTKATSKNIPDNDSTPTKLSSTSGKLPKKKNGSEPKTYGKSGKIGG